MSNYTLGIILGEGYRSADGGGGGSSTAPVSQWTETVRVDTGSGTIKQNAGDPANGGLDGFYSSWGRSVAFLTANGDKFTWKWDKPGAEGNVGVMVTEDPVFDQSDGLHSAPTDNLACWFYYGLDDDTNWYFTDINRVQTASGALTANTVFTAERIPGGIRFLVDGVEKGVFMTEMWDKFYFGFIGGTRETATQTWPGANSVTVTNV